MAFTQTQHTQSVQLMSPVALSPFDPERDDMADFIRQFEVISASQSWPDAQKIATFPLLLSTVPSEWYSEYVSKLILPPTSWSQVKTAFIKAFTRKSGPARAEAQLRNRKMNQDESIDQYLFDVIRLCKRVQVDMPESRKIHFVIRGLQPIYFHQVMAREFPSVDTLRTQLHRLEDAKHIFGKDIPYFDMAKQLSTEINEVKNELINLKTLKQSPNESSSNLNYAEISDQSPAQALLETVTQTSFPHPISSSTSFHKRPRKFKLRAADGQLICYNCTQVGHMSRNCNNQSFCSSCKVPGHCYMQCPNRVLKRRAVTTHTESNKKLSRVDLSSNDLL